MAQLCIHYALQRGIIPLPKSSTIERMKQNQDVFGFEISKEDMYRIGTMAQAGWSGLHPDFWEYTRGFQIDFSQTGQVKSGER